MYPTVASVAVIWVQLGGGVRCATLYWPGERMWEEVAVSRPKHWGRRFFQHAHALLDLSRRADVASAGPVGGLIGPQRGSVRISDTAAGTRRGRRLTGQTPCANYAILCDCPARGSREARVENLSRPPYPIADCLGDSQK
jgi:hypothetical protein